MKRFLSLLFCLTLLLTLAAPLCASASGAGWYVVDSDSPKGYCYLYSEPSSSKGRNLGRYDNGERVYVLDYYGGQEGKYNYCHVQTQDGKTGYMHDYSLTRYYGAAWSDNSAGWYVVQSKEPNGYCYLYSEPSDRDGVGYNKGRHNNGEMVYVIAYYGGQDGNNNYCYVRTLEGNETGYMHDYALVRFTGSESSDPLGGWFTVYSTQPRGYCYLYSAPSDRDELSQNLGRYNNGESVLVLVYYGGQDGNNNYCYVRTSDGKYGYMHDYALERQ
ncbi:MAG: SH3 domain-containing protein [Aristaeellaceae bacterium]